MEELIKRAQQGDELAFEQLLQVCYDSLFRYALKFAGNVADAEDITHQACLKLAKGLAQFRFESAFNSWLYRLVINCAKDWQKSQSRHRHDSVDEHQEAVSRDNVDAQIQLQQVLKQVEAFGEGYKEAVILVLGEGLSHREAADVLEVKESTVSWRIHEVRKRLNPQSRPPTSTREGK